MPSGPALNVEWSPEVARPWSDLGEEEEAFWNLATLSTAEAGHCVFCWEWCCQKRASHLARVLVKIGPCTSLYRHPRQEWSSPPVRLPQYQRTKISRVHVRGPFINFIGAKVLVKAYLTLYLRCYYVGNCGHFFRFARMWDFTVRQSCFPHGWTLWVFSCDEPLLSANVLHTRL